MKRSEFEQRELQYQIRQAAQRPYELTTLLERGERVFSAERFETSHPDAAVHGALRRTAAGREQEQREQEQRRAADREWRRQWQRSKRRRVEETRMQTKGAYNHSQFQRHWTIMDGRVGEVGAALETLRAAMAKMDAGSVHIKLLQDLEVEASVLRGWDRRALEQINDLYLPTSEAINAAGPDRVTGEKEYHTVR